MELDISLYSMHNGIRNMASKLKKLFYWKGMKRYIVEIVSPKS